MAGCHLPDYRWGSTPGEKEEPALAMRKGNS